MLLLLFVRRGGIKDEEAESYMQEYLYRCLKHQLANFYKSKKS
nr:MAG TPA: hypothetical protein [Crassvirales sp.]